MSFEGIEPVFVEPCTRKSDSSLGSRWLSASDFGECLIRPLDSQFYPCLIPVYNGKILNIKSELLHNSLSAISIKHYYGKCIRQEKKEEKQEKEINIDNHVEEHSTKFGSIHASKSTLKVDGSGSHISLDKTNDFEEPTSLLPECVQQRINFRNSFWNLHKPELCKLTWSQNYVSAATVTEHLHEHLVSHGPACADIHFVQDRLNLLDKELEEYGRLKMLASPRELPPDEKPFSWKKPNNSLGCKPRFENRCKGFPLKMALGEGESHFLSISDDEDEEKGKSIRRSKEEFCLTIGRHVRKPPIRKSSFETEEFAIKEEGEYCMGEEESGFFFNWLTFTAEECYEDDTDDSTIDLEPVPPPPLIEPCPVLGMNDFCRAVAKADFSDLRCHPDDF